MIVIQIQSPNGKEPGRRQYWRACVRWLMTTIRAYWRRLRT